MATEEIYAEFRNGTHEKYQLDSTAYLIPTNIDKFGLSKMINDLLGLKEHVDFDIIFNDERLRTTISEKLDEYKISSESTITITYTLASDEPLSIDVDNVSDWIVSLSYAENIDISTICCYDGYVSFYKNDSTEKFSNFTVDKKSSTAIHLHDKIYFESIFEVIIGQINGIIEIYIVDSKDTQHNIIASNNRTSNTITTIVTDMNGEIIIAGDYEHSISIYKNVDIPYKNTPFDDSNDGKRKLNEIETIPLLSTLKNHSKPVTDLALLPSQSNILASSSLDKLLILSDLSTESSLLSCNTGKPATCLTVANNSKIAVGHDDGTISLWDIRMGGTKSIGNDMIGRDSNLTKLCSASVSERLVSDISWNPVNDNILSVIGLDGRMSIIDTRTPKQPLHSVRFELDESYDRGTCCCWTSGTSLLCSTASAFVPSFLKCAGFLIVSDSPELNVHSVHGYSSDTSDLDKFIILNVLYNSDSATSLKDSVTCFSVINKNNELTTSLIPSSNVQWIDDDMSEVNKRQLHLANVSCLIRLGLDTEDDGNTFDDIIGLRSLYSLPMSIKDSVLDALKTRLISSIKVQEYTNLPYDFIINEPSNSSSKDPYYIGLYNSGFGFMNTERKHIFISNDCCNAAISLRILFQTVILIPSNLLDVIHSNESLCYVVDRLCNDLTELSKSTTQLTNLYCYIARDPIETKCDISELPVSDTNVNKITSSQPKHTSKGKSKKQSSVKNKRKTTRNLTEDVKRAPELCPSDLKDTNLRIISALKFDNYYFDMDFYTANGKISLTPSNSGEETADISSIRINLIFKGFAPLNDGTSTPGIPFGGVTLSLCNLLYIGATDSSTDYPFKKRYKLLFHLPDLVNNRILISPHRHYNQHPPWISTKTSKTFLVSGYYQYYHYLHDGFNDVGWGCCYRSIQTICSWYLLQSYTIKPVPNHRTIQELLRQKDTSHKNLVIGSSTWIGTVESGYFINCDASEFRSYNRVIADHFSNLGVPIIMGVGAYAYVILGICIGESQGDVAYLIADPHYTGDDNIKSIHNKAAISWKGVDFIAKVSGGKFINLCCPQLDIYDSNTI